jgi:hypothetical protein
MSNVISLRRTQENRPAVSPPYIPERYCDLVRHVARRSREAAGYIELQFDRPRDEDAITQGRLYMRHGGPEHEFRLTTCGGWLELWDLTNGRHIGSVLEHDIPATIALVDRAFVRLLCGAPDPILAAAALLA